MRILKWLWKNSKWVLNDKGGIFDWVGDLFGGKDEKMPAPQPIETGWQKSMRELIEQYAAGKSPYAERRRSFLEQYLGDEGIPALTQAAETEVGRTLGGYYEPYTGKAYEPFRRQTMRELEEAKTRLGRSAKMVGMRESTPFLGIEGRLEEETLDTLMSKLGSLYETERGRKFQAVPLASEMGRYRAPLTKAGAITEFEESPLRYAMNLLSGYTPSYYQPSYRTSPGLGETGLGLLGSYMQGGGGFDFGGGRETEGWGGMIPTTGGGYLPEPLYGGQPATRKKGFMEQIQPMLEMAKLVALLGG